jgi:hypothetical protein
MCVYIICDSPFPPPSLPLAGLRQHDRDGHQKSLPDASSNQECSPFVGGRGGRPHFAVGLRGGHPVPGRHHPERNARTNIKVSKVAESYISFYEQYVEYDPFVTCTEPLNPWISDTLDFWDQDKSGYDYHPRLIFSFMSISFLFFIPLLSLASLLLHSSLDYIFN